ncbi:MAG: glycosyltransferase family 2 protein [Candidatus Thalassarchaeaceae archaeon]|jgi:GT2 family glycosyltransferase|nr:glycosyltransferase family 2 protein [Candidatus Thalassarchaeaceae archaeon]
MADDSRVCILIPTLRNASELDITLSGLNSQNWGGELQIVVVGPTGDPGEYISEKHGAQWIDDAGSRTRADACNVALKEIDSDFVFFTDDDVWIPEDWVSNLVRWFEKDEVAGVGGPNFAPPDERSTFWQRVIDVTFCSKWVTAGTNYGNRGDQQLTPANQLPGVNAAYRKSVLDEVNGFDKGAIGCEDAMMDYRIEQAGYKLWQDRDAIIWHRRRDPKRVRKQIRNYGLVRILASHQHQGMHAWSHTAVGLFPLLVLTSLLSFGIGAMCGGIAWPEFWDISTNTIPMGWERVAVHTPVSLAGFYIGLCWLGAVKGNSPSRTFSTIIFAPIMTFLMHWSYGRGVQTAWWRIYVRKKPGLQIDDKNRN